MNTDDTYGGYAGDQRIAHLYDLVPGYADRRDLDFYVQAAVDAGGPVLELGCGTGRVLIPTAEAGCDVVGVDASASMLDRLRAKHDALPPAAAGRITVTQGDMTKFDLDRTFSLVTIPFRPFQHLVSVDEQIGCLESVRRHLAPEGRLVFDVFNPKLSSLIETGPSEESEDTNVVLDDGRRFRRTGRVTARHTAEQVVDVELIYYIEQSDGSADRIVQAFPMRYFHRFEVEHLLARSGFRVSSLYGDFDRSALEDASPEMIFVAEPT